MAYARTDGEFAVKSDDKARLQSDSLNAYLQSCERRYIERALLGSGGRIIETATALGISRKTLWEKMRKFGLRGGKQNRMQAS